jgi:hypothetical protein
VSIIKIRLIGGTPGEFATWIADYYEALGLFSIWSGVPFTTTF